MRAPISVVIPTLNAEDALAGCLATLFEGVQASLIREVIVVDGGSDDGTVPLATEAGAEVLTAPPSRGGQLRAGCAKARGDWLLVLHADTSLTPGWTDAVTAHLATRRAGYFRLRFDAPGLMAHIVAGWANLRAALFGMPFGDQGLLLPRTVYDAAGGYSDIPLMEDVALVRMLDRKPVALGSVLTTSAEKYRQQGWLRRGTRNLSLQLRYFLGASPDKLAQVYRKS
ncbi:TIGR04283 family arsenosugar biosynthesis glycosyltransferase [Shimia sediminis]|uniref:TIGR04283 family arsenosugar biosynthesis glycosyltransferase n=1 Tax=Shimia sediminis TaxID=2497945 RepID=UPI000F8C9AD1|nr:TIGR04283 family arsenosugar biosynthesis glycosyltransferase [Shimia sediminis]